MTGVQIRHRAAPPAPPDASTASDFLGALGAAEFTAERIEAALGSGELSAAPGEAAVQRRRLAGDDPFSVLAQLFLLGETVDADDLTKALAPLTIGRLRPTGLLEIAGRSVRATARLLPHGDYVIASDVAAADPPADWVAGVQAPSVTLAKLAVRRRVEATLDVGTGCGIQALLAAKHSGRVVATDVNPRALGFVRFNAALNAVDGIEPRHGDLLDPAAGETFGLIVANPPYVISPDSTYLYRDSGYPADEVCRRLVEGLPAHLEEGGFAHVLVSWVERPGDDWEDSLRTWVRGSGCDAWLLHYKTDDPITHAAGWLGPLATSPQEHGDALDRWLSYLRESDIEAVGYGAVILRRRTSGTNWIRLDELPLERLEPAGEHTLRVFAAEDFLAQLPEERSLLDERFELVNAHRLEQELVCRGGRFDVEQQTLVLTEGLAFRAGLDRNTLILLPHFAPERRLADVLAAAADDLDVTAGDRERFATAAIPVVRRLLQLGFLVRSAAAEA
jgi:Methyltransferase small domain